MKRLGTLISLCALGSGAVLQVSMAAESESSRVDAIFAPLNHADAPGCAVSVVKDGRVVHERGYGMANLDYGLAITPDTVFYIASTSKQFTAAAVALLAEEGKISLNDDIRKYVPEIPAYGQTIRVRHLVHHTSGLRDYLTLWTKAGRSFADSIPEEQAIALIARQDQLEFAPGSKYSYSNSGYFLLSVIVKRASGQPLSQYAQEKIFGPLGMTNTHFHDDRTRIVRNRATAYLKREGEEGGDLSVEQTSFDLVGDGGLMTTVRDMVRWDQNFYHNVLGKRGQALIDQLQSTEPLTDGKPNTYAFGLQKSEIDGVNMLSHGGSFIGFVSNYVRIPERRLSLITFCNTREFHGGIASEVMSVYVPESKR